MKHSFNLVATFALGAVAAFPLPAFAQTSPGSVECPAAELPAGAAEIEQGIGDRRLAEAQGEVLMRIGPSFFCESKYLVPAGGTVELQECEQDWCLVAYGNEIGYLPVLALDRVPDRAPDVDDD